MAPVTSAITTAVAGLVWIDGQQYGTAPFIAAHLTSPERTITAGRVRDWARRSRTPADRLYRTLPGLSLPGARTGSTWYRLADAAAVELATRRDDVASDHTLVQ